MSQLIPTLPTTWTPVHAPTAAELAGLLAGFPITGLVTVDQFATNTTTLQPAVGCAVTLASGYTYRITSQLWYNAPAANDMKVSLTGPSQSLLWWTLHSIPGGGTQGQWWSGSFSAYASSAIAEGQAAVGIAVLEAVVTTTGAGDFQVQFAENVAGAATSAIIQRGSHITAQIIG